MPLARVAVLTVVVVSLLTADALAPLAPLRHLTSADGCTRTAVARFRVSSRRLTDDDAAAAEAGGGEPAAAATLVMRVQFAPATDAAAVRTFLSERFSFAAALPVQPLATERTESGIRLLFRRKPNAEKGTIDGGLDFRVVAASGGGGGGGGGGVAAEQEEEVDAAGPTLEVTRITDGAVWNKLIAEKLVCKQLLARLEALEETTVVSVVHEHLPVAS